MMRNRILFAACPIAVMMGWCFGALGADSLALRFDREPSSQTFLVSQKPASYYDEDACDEEVAEFSDEEMDDDDGRRTRIVEIRYGRGIEHDYRLEEEDDEEDDEFDWVRHG